MFLASYMISEMDSIIFVFDEPTIGLHETGKQNLIRIIKKLVSSGNTVVAVEHDENFMREADYIIDMGPLAGIHGGMKIYEGGYREFLNCAESKTSPYLSPDFGFPVKKAYRPVDMKKCLTISGANLHNLQNVCARIPLGVMVGVAGVSGSGKSSLISDTLVPKLKELLKSKCVTDEEEAEKTVDAVLEGVGHIRHCYVIDQRPIGRSRTSCPATYTGIFDKVRNLFAKTPEALEKGYTAGLSFYDTERLMELLNELVDNGNSIIVTEHDPYVLSNCDYILEMGPGGGKDGGILIAEGTPAELKEDRESVIGKYLR